jgi:hypothetical protein
MADRDQLSENRRSPWIWFLGFLGFVVACCVLGFGISAWTSGSDGVCFQLNDEVVGDQPQQFFVVDSTGGGGEDAYQWMNILTDGMNVNAYEHDQVASVVNANDGSFLALKGSLPAQFQMIAQRLRNTVVGTPSTVPAASVARDVRTLIDYDIQACNIGG